MRKLLCSDSVDSLLAEQLAPLRNPRPPGSGCSLQIPRRPARRPHRHRQRRRVCGQGPAAQGRQQGEHGNREFKGSLDQVGLVLFSGGLGEGSFAPFWFACFLE